MRPAFTAFLLASAAAACTPQPPPPPDAGPTLAAESLPGVPDEGPHAGTPDAGGSAPAAEPTAPGLPLLSAEALLPDGSAQPLWREGVTTVDASARFRVEVGARIPDARLSLLDAQDAMVAADGIVEIAASARFTLTPAAPLRPGSSYTLRLDGAEGRLVRAEDGRSFEPLSLALRTSGKAPPPARKAKRRTRK